MASSTEVLRAMLDERGAEHEDDEDVTRFFGPDGFEVVMQEDIDGKLDCLTPIYLTPAQAIEATLGRGECHNASNVTDKHGQARFVCSACNAWLDSRMLWNPEYPNGESPFVKDCRLNFCPNCGRRVVEE